MISHRTVQRIFYLIAQLQGSLGCSKKIKKFEERHYLSKGLGIFVGRKIFQSLIFIKKGNKPEIYY